MEVDFHFLDPILGFHVHNFSLIPFPDPSVVRLALAAVRSHLEARNRTAIIPTPLDLQAIQKLFYVDSFFLLGR